MSLLVVLLFIIFTSGVAFANATNALIFNGTAILPPSLTTVPRMSVVLTPHDNGSYQVSHGWGDEISAGIQFNGDNTATITVDFSGLSEDRLLSSQIAEVAFYFDVVNNGDVDVVFGSYVMPNNNNLHLFFADNPAEQRLDAGQRWGQWGRVGTLVVQLNNDFTPSNDPVHFTVLIPFDEA